jgi:hypothetical protein
MSGDGLLFSALLCGAVAAAVLLALLVLAL